MAPARTGRKKRDLVVAAREWAASVGARAPGFRGAFLHGSILAEEDEAVIPQWSDVDVVVVLDVVEPATPAAPVKPLKPVEPGKLVGPGKREHGKPVWPVKPGKLLFRGALLDVTYVASERIFTPERVLADYRLAPSLARLHVLADPGGRLAEVHHVVSREYPKPEWIERRILDARENALDKLRSVPRFDRLHDRVMAWIFSAGVLCHILLVAGLRNPTVRKRYLAARELLLAHGREEAYEELLRLVGCSHMSPDRALFHLERMSAAFDAAKGRAGDAPFPFAADISDLARPASVDGSREMIERGDHREAVFWIAVTYCRCLKVLEAGVNSGPGSRAEAFETHAAGFAELIADLGVMSPHDAERRAADVEVALPAVMEVARSITPAP